VGADSIGFYNHAAGGNQLFQHLKPFILIVLNGATQAQGTPLAAYRIGFPISAETAQVLIKREFHFLLRWCMQILLLH
jgi:hypothetical protein